MAMKLTHAALGAAAVLALATGAFAKSAVKDLDCPSAAASEARIAALEGQLGLLEAQLDALDDRVSSLGDLRRNALDKARQRIEAAARDQRRSPEQIDAEVSVALIQAKAEGEAAALAVRAVQAQMDQIRRQMETVRQEMHALAAHGMDADTDAG
jgi:chromosome segregation ATPase